MGRSTTAALSERLQSRTTLQPLEIARNRKRLSPSKPTRVIPAKAGTQPWGHGEATTIAGKPSKAAQCGKPCSAEVFWMLAFASMTLVGKATPVIDRRLRPGLPRVDSFVERRGLIPLSPEGRGVRKD